MPEEFWEHPALRAALAARDIGAVIRAYRRHPHHGRLIRQETVASWINLSSTRLSRIENGEAVHDLTKLTRWAQRLRIPQHRLWFQLPDASPDSSALAAQTVERQQPTVDAHPLTFDDLRWDAPPRRLVGRTEVEQVRLMTGALAASENLYGGGMAGEAGIAHLRWACRTLQARSAPTVRPRLLEAVGNLAAVVGFSAFDVGDHDTAARCFRVSLWCAEEGGSWELRAATLTDMARQAIHLGKLDEALSLVEFAQVRADRVTATARAATAVVRARVLALLGRHDEAAAEVGRADAHFAQRQVAADPPWLVYYDEAEHAGSSARALIPIALSRKRPGDAALRLSMAIDLHSDAYPRSRAFSTARLAALHMAVGDPHEAVVLGQRAVMFAANLHSKRMSEELRILDHASRPHVAIPAVAGLSRSLASVTGDV
ncbi:XRE family transcriptional regulator [Saccharothrix sp. NPDC042600]|uniref:helix-turn-helix domain-containing protein n=1 Tax=Saccharothrix TaxID=2071 RepID=UPI0033D6C99B